MAEALNRIGVAGFVLKYRLAREPGSTYKVEEHALADAQRAIRLVRSRAKEWRVNPARIGILGFSAGGEVAALAATRFDPRQSGAADPVDRVSSRPDFDDLIYPGIRADNYTIPADMPRTFLLCADNDRGPRPVQRIGACHQSYASASGGVGVDRHKQSLARVGNGAVGGRHDANGLSA